MVQKDYSKAIIPFDRIEVPERLEERAVYPFGQLNYLTGGMELGEMSVIAGETGAGKTTFISQCVSKMIEDDKVFCIYGESTLEKQAQAIYRQMTPYSEKDYVYLRYEKYGKSTNIGQYFVTEEARKRVLDKTAYRLYCYNTKYGMTINDIIGALGAAHGQMGINYFLIDNIMQIETATLNEVKEMKDSIELLRRFVIENRVHVILVAHYRKSQDYSIIRRRLEEICGTSAIGNKMATALNIMRLDNVDRSGKGYKNLSAVCLANNYDLDKADSVVEVLKTRHNKLGFVALKYNKTTNTYSECPKLDAKKEEPEKPILYARQRSLHDLQVLDPQDADLPF